jgi:hypothetical protein
VNGAAVELAQAVTADLDAYVNGDAAFAGMSVDVERGYTPTDETAELGDSRRVVVLPETADEETLTWDEDEHEQTITVCIAQRVTPDLASRDAAYAFSQLIASRLRRRDHTTATYGRALWTDQTPIPWDAKRLKDKSLFFSVCRVKFTLHYGDQ